MKQETIHGGDTRAPVEGVGNPFEPTIDTLIARLGEVLAEIQRLPQVIGPSFIDAILPRLDCGFPCLWGAASKYENCEVIAALVWGPEIPTNDTEAELALKIGRVFLEADSSPGSELLMLAALVVAADNKAQKAEARR